MILQRLTFLLIFCASVPRFTILEIITLQKDYTLICVMNGEDNYENALYVDPISTKAFFSEKSNSIKHRLIKNNWSKVNFSDSKSKIGPVLDKRWEDFQLIYNDYILFELKSLITFSVFGATDLKIKYFEHPAHLNSYNLPTENNPPSKGWTHYSLARVNDKLIVYKNSIHILNVYIPSALQHLIIRSSKEIFWKRHEYSFHQFSYKDNELAKTSIQPILKLEVHDNGNTCLSIMVSMCYKCELKIQIHSGKSTSIQTVKNNDELPLARWQAVTMKINVEKLDAIDFIPSSNSDQPGDFWAIDENSLRRCPDNYVVKEFLIREPSKDYICRSLNPKNSNNQMPFDMSKVGFLLNNLTCSDIFQYPSNCDRYKIKREHHLESGVCSWGYKQPNCLEKCNKGFYGIDCKQKCTGLCSTNNCDYQRGCPENDLFLESLRLDFSSRNNTIYIKSSELINIEGSKLIVKYQFKRKLSCHLNPKWQNLSNVATIYVSTNETIIMLEGLQYFAEYFVEVLIIIGGKETKFTENVKTESYYKIDETSEDNIIYLGDDNKLKVNCQRINGEINMTLSIRCLNIWCEDRTRNYAVFLGEGSAQEDLMNIMLQPFTENQIIVIFRRFEATDYKNMTIKSYPGPPLPVKHLKVTPTASELRLQWKPPYPPTGNISHYIIQCTGNENFNHSVTEPANICEDLCSFTISPLKDETYYVITIFVINQHVEEFKSSIKTITVQTDEKVPEAPIDVELGWKRNIQKFQLTCRDNPNNRQKSTDSFFTDIIRNRKKIKLFNYTCTFSVSSDLHLFSAYNISVAKQGKYLGKAITMVFTVFPSLNISSNEHFVIEKCKNETNCTLVISGEEQKVATLLPYKNESNEPNFKECLELSYNQWRKCPYKFLSSGFYQRGNFEGGTGIIFNWNDQIYYVLDPSTEPAEKSFIRLIVISLGIFFILLAPCKIYMIYRVFKRRSYRVEDSREALPLTKMIHSKSRPIEIKYLADYLKNCLENPCDEMEIVKSYQHNRSRFTPENESYKFYIEYYSISCIIAKPGAQFKPDLIYKMFCKENIENIVTFSDQVNYYLVVFPISLNLHSSVISTEKFEKYTKKVFKISFNNEMVRVINYYQFPEINRKNILKNVVDIVLLLNEVLAIIKAAPLSIILQNKDCDMSGLIILCEICKKMIEIEDGNVDFLKAFLEIQSRNSEIVPTVEEYVFSHLYILDWLHSEKYSIPVNLQLENAIIDRLADIKMTNFINDLDRMKEIQLIFEANFEDSSRSRHEKYKCDQQPRRDDLITFWRNILRSNTEVIVSLNDIGNDPDVVLFWPETVGAKKILDEFTLEFISIQSNEYLATYKIKLKNSEGLFRNITLIQMHHWRAKRMKPTYLESILFIWKQLTDHFSNLNGTILLTCYDGFTSCGILLSWMFLAEKIINDKICDIYTAIRRARQYNSDFVRDWGQIELLHKLVMEYFYKFEDGYYTSSYGDNKIC